MHPSRVIQHQSSCTTATCLPMVVLSEALGSRFVKGRVPCKCVPVVGEADSQLSIRCMPSKAILKAFCFPAPTHVSSSQIKRSREKIFASKLVLDADSSLHSQRPEHAQNGWCRQSQCFIRRGRCRLLKSKVMVLQYGTLRANTEIFVCPRFSELTMRITASVSIARRHRWTVLLPQTAKSSWRIAAPSFQGCRWSRSLRSIAVLTEPCPSLRSRLAVALLFLFGGCRFRAGRRFAHRSESGRSEPMRLRSM